MAISVLLWVRFVHIGLNARVVVVHSSVLWKRCAPVLPSSINIIYRESRANELQAACNRIVHITITFTATLCNDQARPESIDLMSKGATLPIPFCHATNLSFGTPLFNITHQPQEHIMIHSKTHESSSNEARAMQLTQFPPLHC